MWEGSEVAWRERKAEDGYGKGIIRHSKEGELKRELRVD